ncbi:Holliday junction resolvase RuvX [Homoserinibacter sp. GY 40078]|uniref:Holliday junction resolvase RuvX n=1 Tax=Homoserinibacter sp. GY 40078 TaxID=2603275 RepID=UPI0011C9CBE1|nr:Holliday junction resolvase RuvX [Homoserinibacter sp. GY 40078]TXK17533.1 Holliday junction resolvase RuvX [Homoserinibacter sp. GY 40078]
MRRGVRVGVDVGRARVGAARCDPDALIATPIATLARGDETIQALLAHAEELDAIEFVVGLPLSLNGGDTPSTTDARKFAQELADASARPVRLVDERLSTVTAHRQLQAGGRRAKTSRSVVDQVAAVIILQNALDSERTSGRPPGAVVPRTKDPERGL